MGGLGIDQAVWILVLIAMAILGVPWSALLFSKLSSRGVLAAAPIGLFIAHWLAWLGLFTPWATNGRTYTWSILAIFATMSLALSIVTRRDLASAWQQRRLWLAGVAILLATYGLGVGLRLLNPEIAATEKPMDLALLNASIHSATYPPHDPWFSGEPINYYYLGYSMAGFLANLAGVTGEIAYNLFLATLLAFTVATTTFAAHDLAVLVGARRRLWIVVTTSAVAGVFAGNLIIIRAVFSDEFRERVGFWDGVGWNASRVIQHQGSDGLSDFTINEFPAFSFVLGDLHPHVMALPFSIIAIALALQWTVAWWKSNERMDGGGIARAILSGILLGGLYGINAWDLPTFAVLVFGGGVTAQALTPRPRRWSALALAVMVAIGALVGSWLPYFLQFQPISNTIGLVAHRTHVLNFVQVFGLLVPITIAGMWACLWDDGQRTRVMMGVLAIAAVLAIVALGGEIVGALVILVGAASFVGIRHRNNVGSVAFAWLCIAAFGLLLLVELVFLDDFFGPPHERMNTVFKVHFQAWCILAVLSGPALLLGMKRLYKGVGAHWATVRITFVGLGAVLSVMSLSYPIVAVIAKSDASPHTGTLDGLAFARMANADDVTVAKWLREQASESTVILEAPGRAYSDDSRISTWSGVPTVIGWGQHQELWRGADPRIPQRQADAALVYTSDNPAKSLSVLHRYGVTHVVYGDIERRRFGTASERHLRSFLTPVFVAGRTLLFTVPPPA